VSSSLCHAAIPLSLADLRLLPCCRSLLSSSSESFPSSDLFERSLRTSRPTFDSSLRKLSPSLHYALIRVTN
jgi:hypothetical protein